MNELAPTGVVLANMAHLKRQKITCCKDNVPSVHGRPNTSLNVKTRLSNHQRNLSLDFR